MAIERHTTEETADDLSRRYGAAYLPLLTVTAVTAASTMMISGTSIGVVVPDVMGAFGVGQDKAQLMATAFYIAMTVSQLLSVWLGGLLGQRRAFSISLLLFAMASVVGATAEDFSLIVVARVVQGVGAGLIQTQTMLALFQAFPAERRGMASMQPAWCWRSVRSAVSSSRHSDGGIFFSPRCLWSQACFWPDSSRCRRFGPRVCRPSIGSATRYLLLLFIAS